MPKQSNKHAKPAKHAPGAQPRDEAKAAREDVYDAGGKVDADAIVAAMQHAREQGLEGEDDEQLRRVRFALQHDLDKRLDKYLTDRISFLSRTQLQKLIDDGEVTVNGRVAKASTRLNGGDVVEVVVPAPPAKDIQPENLPLEVMYEDEHILVVNKQPGIIVHPARNENTGTMLGALAWHLKHNSSGALSAVGKELARPGVVHRLDRDTSGCIVFAKTDEAHWKMGHQFEHRSVDKRYLAVVHGYVEPENFVIDLPLGPHPSREKGYREKYVVRHDELGKASVTIVRVRERYGVGDVSGAAGAHTGELVGRQGAMTGTVSLGHADTSSLALGWSVPQLPKTANLQRTHTNLFEAEMERFSLVELELKTGRTHQIRVHLSHNMWPIVGDDMYGGKAVGVVDAGNAGATTKAAKAKPGKTAKTSAAARGPLVAYAKPEAIADGSTPMMTRQALHAALLSFDHPMSGKRMTFTAPLRGDMAALVAALRARSGGGEQLAAPGATVDITKL
jgi:23S rRNA pseudouridine1911/1915/1917 synthase